MNLDKLEEVLSSEPQYRIKQVKFDLFQRLISDWDQATTLPLSLREKLKKEFPLLLRAKTLISKDQKTVKALITFDDGLSVESVLMRHNGRNTVCVSSQVGCPLACLFCATGKMGFKRNLTSQEIIAQVLFFARYLKNFKPAGKVSNVVFMGMGEPLLNFEQVIGAIRILNDKNCFNLGARKISLSTSGIAPGIKKLADLELGINLAISLNAAEDKLRSKLMPINKKYPIKEVLKAVNFYIAKTNRKVMFEYLLISGVNDSLKQAEELSKIVRRNLYLVNLIRYNPTGKFKPSGRDQIEMFRELLEKKGVNVTQRFSFGQDIKAACGQLATQETPAGL
ncbi:23S rRNA (adenine(2503)-C(2))-methyltransferase RlmN [Patescibacteria group bacterium]|nr:23S rRNA (adenine(2503)-C(2))-methyltransferase RlmN [Patescibacteria group bacterium]